MRAMIVAAGTCDTSMNICQTHGTTARTVICVLAVWRKWILA
jgi:hypothetical protein